MKMSSCGGNKFWLQVMDDATGNLWSIFMKKKSQLSNEMTALIKHLRTNDINVKKIRCDGAGENKKFEENAMHEGLGLTLEYTSPNTPQRNGRVERKLRTLFDKARAMLNTAGFPLEMKQKFWAEAASTATKLENLMVHKTDEKCPHELFWDRKPEYWKFLRTFGEMGVVKIHTKIRGKWKIEEKLVFLLDIQKHRQLTLLSFLTQKQSGCY